MTNASHENKQTSPQNSLQYRILKAAVIVMGVMIIVGVSVIIVTLVSRAFGDKEPQVPHIEALDGMPPSRTSPMPPIQSFGDIKVSAPAGMSLKSAQLQGPHLLLHFSSQGDGGEVLEILRLRDGVSMGRILITNDR